MRATDDGGDRTKKLVEGKDLHVDRNKHILLAEKYGWVTVACYNTDPLASTRRKEDTEGRKGKQAVEGGKEKSGFL